MESVHNQTSSTPWWKKTSVYQIYVPAFFDSNGDGIGDLRGILDKLDYLESLHINTLCLSPIFKSPKKDFGFDISDFLAIDSDLGSEEDFRALISAVHDRHMHLLLDLPVNYTSNEHPWFIASCSGEDNPYRDYYIWRKPQDFRSLFDAFDENASGASSYPPDESTSLYGGSAWQYDPASNSYYYHFLSSSQPELNWQNIHLRHEIYRIMDAWLHRGVDGFRFENADLIGKDIDEGVLVNGQDLHRYFREMRQVLGAYPDIFLIGETWNINPSIASLYTAPDREELSAIINYDPVIACWDTILGKWKTKPLEASKLQETFDLWQSQGLDEISVPILIWESFELPRLMSLYGHKDYPLESATMYATLMYLQRGIPWIYQGQELGLQNPTHLSLEDYNDLESSHFIHTSNFENEDDLLLALHQGSRINSRIPLLWDDVTFSDNKILAYYRELLHFLSSSQELTQASYLPLPKENNDLISYCRITSDLSNSFFILGNTSDTAQEGILDLSLLKLESTCQKINLSLSNIDFLSGHTQEKSPFQQKKSKIHWNLRPFEIIILVCQM